MNQENIAVLMAKLPRRYGAAKKIAEELNQKGIKTKYGRKYTAPNVINALNGKHVDKHVLLTLIQLVEFFKKETAQIEKVITEALQ